jgi:LysM repeat protein
MVDAEEKDYDYEKRKEIPGVAVYIAGKEEPLWNVAKAYGSSVEEIRNLNQMEGTDLKAGQKILVVKKVRELL